jgi:glycosyltransferase involved in cell wall biosynthesis
MCRRYAIVTPVKNEEDFLPKTIESVLKQTIRPGKWIIVNDMSTDKTDEIIQQAVVRYEWITGIESGDSTNQRKAGGESIIDRGIHLLNLEEYNFLSRLDGDISFDADYFERLIHEFEKNQKLGIAGGICYVPVNEKLVEETHPKFHVRGAVKTYRVPCLKQIGGLGKGLGWDAVDEIKANMLGWQTQSFPAIKVIHHRGTQSFAGRLKGKRNFGEAAYYLGYHPIFMFLRVLKNMTRRPYFWGAVNMLIGFISGYTEKRAKINDPAFIQYLREQQLNKLLGKETIWK